MLAWTSSGGRGFQLGWAGLGWETAVNLIGFGEHRAHSAGGGVSLAPVLLETL